MSPAPPFFSVICAVYNVEQYLDAFIHSIETQRIASGDVEILAIDDGSTDSSLSILERWAQTSRFRVFVRTQANRGQGAARNLGLAHASGDWVTFPDPDDVLAEDYFAQVSRALARWPECDMVATNRLILRDGEVSDSHPLRSMFAAGDRLVDLESGPFYFHGSAPAAFFRRSRLERSGITFDSSIRPNFEDGHFCAHYLLTDTAKVAFLQSAKYEYRKRSDGSSTLQGKMAHPGHFSTVLSDGYLEVLQHAATTMGSPPAWLQALVIYELSWYLSEDDRIGNSDSALSTEAAVDTFHELMGQIIPLLSEDVIENFTARGMKSIWADVLLHGWRPQAWHTDYMMLGARDARQGLAKLIYRYVGPPPEHQVLLDGVPTAPVHQKIRGVRYFERTILWEKVLWVRDGGALSARLGGKPVELRYSWPPRTRTVLDANEVASRLTPGRPEALPTRDTVRRAYSSVAAVAGRQAWKAMGARSKLAASRFSNAWVFLDRIGDSDDSAEITFDHVRRTRPHVNAWFVVAKDTPDWVRLQRSQHRDRLVAYGSLKWQLLMANCDLLISSHADKEIIEPAEITRTFGRPWKFAFLQHGVTKDDLSNWLNPKRLDLFVTSTVNEHASVAGDGTAYNYTTKEAVLTELPRFDRLLAQAERRSGQAPDTVLVAPTWREWLNAPLEAGETRRRLREDFADSEYVANWLALLRSEHLRRTARARGLRVQFLPHPNLRDALSTFALPDDVEGLSYDDGDVRAHFVRAAALVTDYSSMAFNVAYLERPVVYFQFDHDRVMSGGHLGRRGYFDYATQGFGPVAQTLEDAVSSTMDVLESAPDMQAEYLGRVQAAFPYRDGGAAERVVVALEGLFRSAETDPVAPPRPSESASDEVPA